MAILAILTINLFIGLYNGFLVTILHIIAYLGSWILGFIFYPVLSKYIIANTNLLEKIAYYTDVSSRLVDFQHRQLGVESLNGEQLATIVEKSQIPQPFGKAILANATNESLINLQTLGEYFDYTIAKVIIGILSFFIIFFVVRFIFTIIIGIVKTIRDIPILKQLDTLAGAGLGLVRGLLVLYIIFSILPLLTTIAPVDILLDLIESSKFAPFFYKTNILINFIR